MNDLEKKENEIKVEQTAGCFWEMLQKPIKPIIGWSIFGGSVALIVLIDIIIFLSL